ncbi:MAG: TonB-dependent receptor plug domain-containing protein, partial [Leeuwenhoekiella sp.]
MHFKITFPLFLFSLFGFAQEITVVDEETRQPVINAALFNAAKSTSAVTGFNGKVDISAFTNSETINITHVSHLDKKTTKAAIIAAGNMVFLKDDENELNEVVLSVAKFSQQKQDLPQQIITISKEEVEFFNPQTAADLLDNSGVFVQKSQLGGGSPMIRGFSTNRLLIT